MSDLRPDTAGVIAPPPLVFGAAVGIGLLLQRARPLPILPPAVGKPLGAVLAAAGIGLGLAAVRALQGAGTNVDPYEQTSAIVEGGPYGFSRNPIYVAMGLLGAGVGLLANAGWVLTLLPAAVAVVQKGVVEREEAYLTRLFPDAYPAYKGRVRRWF
jgi:protein-S-isoprenylcysteine O-methyltransferase Ste14